jgi:hypothetical protein
LRLAVAIMSELQSLIQDVWHYVNHGVPSNLSIPLILFLLVALRALGQFDAPSRG